MELLILFLLYGGGAFAAVVFLGLAFASKSRGSIIALIILAVICLVLQAGCWNRAAEFGRRF